MALHLPESHRTPDSDREELILKSLKSKSKMSGTETVTRITAENVATIFPDVDTSLAREVFPTASTTTARESNELEGYDEEQVRLMDEVCIVLDDDDKPIGSASKKTCTSSPIQPKILALANKVF